MNSKGTTFKSKMVHDNGNPFVALDKIIGVDLSTFCETAPQSKTLNALLLVLTLNLLGGEL